MSIERRIERLEGQQPDFDAAEAILTAREKHQRGENIQMPLSELEALARQQGGFYTRLLQARRNVERA